MNDRIARCFARLRAEGRGGLITFTTAGDPDVATSTAILGRLPVAGADLIELGVPFTDPMADGPSIQASSQRALKAGMTVSRTLAMVAEFRRDDQTTPVILMGYYNPIYARGTEAFCREAAAAGVDGLIIVDLPPEEADEVLAPATAAGLDLIFLAAPTTSDERLPTVLRSARGFLYFVSITGVTGTRSASAEEVAGHIGRIRHFSSLPVAVGFGIGTPEQAAAMAANADAVVVGSALVRIIAEHLADDRPGTVDAVIAKVAALAQGVRQAKRAVA